MKVMFFGNLLEATKDLGDDEILFCPLYNWVAWLNNKIGGVVEDSGRVRSPTFEELHGAENHLLLGYHTYRESFFYVAKPAWTRKHLEELSKEIKKNEEYLKKEIIEDLIYVDPLFEYDLFLDISKVTSLSEALEMMIENTKTIVEGEVRKEIVDVERKKEEKYIEALSKVLEYNPLRRGLDLVFVLTPEVRKKGTGDYIKKGELYNEATREEKKVLIITLPNYHLHGPERDKILDGIEIKYHLSEPKIDGDLVYLVLGEFKIPHGEREMTYLSGFPFFKAKLPSVDVEFRSRNVSIRRREKTEGAEEGADGTGGVVKAGLSVNSFMITAEYTKEPKVIESGKGTRTIETKKSLLVTIKRENRTGGEFSSPKMYKVCDIEIQKDGGFSVEMNYSNTYKVQVIPSHEAKKEVIEVTEKEPREGVSWLIEKWTKGKETINFGRIVEEKVEDSIDKSKVFVLKDEEYNDKESNRMGIYIKSKLEEVIKNILKEESAEGKKEKHSEVISLKPEERKEIIKEIQTGFIQDKVRKNLEYLEKIEELCFESREGERIGIKHPYLEKQEETIKMAEEAALYGAGIDVEGLKGDNKSVMEVIKLVSYSFPFLTQYSLNKILSELKEKVNSALSKDVVPLKEVDVSIETINPSISIDYIPKVLALFSIEGDKVKVYINDGKEQDRNENIVEYIKMGIGDIEIKI